jgi:hypothetical protein
MQTALCIGAIGITGVVITGWVITLKVQSMARQVSFWLMAISCLKLKFRHTELSCCIPFQHQYLCKRSRKCKIDIYEPCTYEQA